MQPQQQQKVYKRKAFSVESERYVMKRLADLGAESLEFLDVRVRNDINKTADRLALNHVFGEGNTKEVGLGSPAQPTKQSVDAYEKFGKGEPNYIEHLAKMREDLAKYQAKRAKEDADREAQEETELE
jgi:hypothetical protein